MPLTENPLGVFFRAALCQRQVIFCRHENRHPHIEYIGEGKAMTERSAHDSGSLLERVEAIHDLLHRGLGGDVVSSHRSHGELTQGHGGAQVFPENADQHVGTFTSLPGHVYLRIGVAPNQHVRLPHHLCCHVGVDVELSHDGHAGTDGFPNRGQNVPFRIIESFAHHRPVKFQQYSVHRPLGCNTLQYLVDQVLHNRPRNGPAGMSFGKDGRDQLEAVGFCALNKPPCRRVGPAKSFQYVPSLDVKVIPEIFESGGDLR